ncbi:hypothetical protein [Herbaspirillum sp. ST 5-3]|uniref:hypothetical protein n=1 Tax=Oxalobacteraceae TaxID=75682 RepID=UPI0010A52D8D|nr:hypothetical protein [Herbaspirillum sp. ST 5-3]
MRTFSLLALFMLVPATFALAEDADFSGAWVAWICPAGVQRASGKCSNFTLELHQQGNKLCGAHFFATAGAANIDEGAAPSLMGDIVDGKANLVAVSSRASPPVRLRVEIRKHNDSLQWQRLDDPAGNYLLPLQARLTKSKSKTLFAPIFAHELKAACLSAFTMVDNSRAREPEPQKQ